MRSVALSSWRFFDFRLTREPWSYRQMDLGFFGGAGNFIPY